MGLILYEQLKQLIDEENQHYRVFNDRIQAATSEDEVSELRTAKYQFIKEYAQKLYNFIWENLSELTPKDCTAFDLVPYSVWSSLNDKYVIIIEHIKQLSEGGDQ